MSVGVQITRGELAAALGWLVDAGVDTLVEDVPRDWLGEAGRLQPDGGQVFAGSSNVAMALAAPRRSAAPLADNSFGRHAGSVAASDAPQSTARQLAASADNLSALAAAVAQFYPASPPWFDAGDAAGGLMLVGDAPTADDAAAGHVFAGQAGLLLDRMLASIGRDRGSAYLTNVTYWVVGPDAAALAPFRERQIELARPRAILALGGIAASALCGVNAGINRLRGRWQAARVGDLEVPVLPTFHPNYLLKQPAHKTLAWADLCTLRVRLDQ